MFYEISKSKLRCKLAEANRKKTLISQILQAKKYLTDCLLTLLKNFIDVNNYQLIAWYDFNDNCTSDIKLKLSYTYHNYHRHHHKHFHQYCSHQYHFHHHRKLLLPVLPPKGPITDPMVN